MLWLVGSLDLISMFCPAMTPIMCGLYMQPFWSSRTAVVGTAQFLSGRPDFTHTNAYFSVPLPFTTTVSDLAGASLCARSQAGFADISIVAILGASPVNATLPVIVPPLASSGIAAAPPAAAGALSVFAVSGALSPPHPTSVRAAASPTPIQIFFMLNQSPCLTGRTGLLACRSIFKEDRPGGLSHSIWYHTGAHLAQFLGSECEHVPHQQIRVVLLISVKAGGHRP